MTPQLPCKDQASTCGLKGTMNYNQSKGRATKNRSRTGTNKRTKRNQTTYRQEKEGK